MSLAITLYNHHGIVMCTDKLVNTTVNEVTMHGSFTEQKLFLVENKYGLSYSGTASIDSIPVSALIEDYLNQNQMNDLNPSEWLLQMANYFHDKLSDNQNIVFIFCGYYNNGKFVLDTNTLKPKINSSNKAHGLIHSGETYFTSHIIDSKLVAFDYIKFTIQDSINFLRFLNETIANMMYFGQMLPTVSKECDILVIQPNNTRWV